MHRPYGGACIVLFRYAHALVNKIGQRSGRCLSCDNRRTGSCRRAVSPGCASEHGCIAPTVGACIVHLQLVACVVTRASMDRTVAAAHTFDIHPGRLRWALGCPRTCCDRSMQDAPRDWSRIIARIYREESRRVLATLIRLLHDFELAEDALQDALAAAVEKWPADGLPANPRAWLVSAGRFKAIDKLRRRTRFDAATDELIRRYDTVTSGDVELDAPDMKDDRLRLIFTCCHPAIPFDAQVALTLREVCGLTTEEIARAYLTSPTTLAQRIVRAKRK